MAILLSSRQWQKLWVMVLKSTTTGDVASERCFLKWQRVPVMMPLMVSTIIVLLDAVVDMVAVSRCSDCGCTANDATVGGRIVVEVDGENEVDAVSGGGD